MFTGSSKALTEEGILTAAQQLGVGPAEVWTVLMVETGGCGFLPDRRPPILFERHYFHRLTGGRFEDGDISDPKAGGWGAAGSHQYERLARAIALDREAALQSTSWGMGQIMGENFASAGFTNVDAMVNAMAESEDAQIAAMSSFVRVRPTLANPLKAHDWPMFAKAYNGPNYGSNSYDTKLRDAFQSMAGGKLPDLQVRAAQLYMTFLGLNPGPVDGIMGPKLEASLARLQVTTVDDALIVRLEKMLSG